MVLMVLLLCRDLDDIGATDIAIQPLNKLPYGRIDASKAKFGDGVIFLTYSSLISSSDKVRQLHKRRPLVAFHTGPYCGGATF